MSQIKRTLEIILFCFIAYGIEFHRGAVKEREILTKEYITRLEDYRRVLRKFDLFIMNRLFENERQSRLINAQEAQRADRAAGF